ncbi:unnamed protein product (plasmid) [Mycetohabitans rhizoxinica HKI 454]|uniref:Uncharacterized protein n=1 Tax=Mycetohabitans rhizoxinica (strain DSM 19002 / CIP 109453 / HKI 454) TaxID=882378 RepID=E5AVW8_MYCRK|nr:unnamed protein product [Mycetohabitans rhizoxinica HKI 454]
MGLAPFAVALRFDIEACRCAALPLTAQESARRAVFCRARELLAAGTYCSLVRRPFPATVARAPRRTKPRGAASVAVLNPASPHV